MNALLKNGLSIIVGVGFWLVTCAKYPWITLFSYTPCSLRLSALNNSIQFNSIPVGTLGYRGDDCVTDQAAFRAHPFPQSKVETELN